MVSVSVSPFDVDVESADEKPSTLPPSDSIADSNESRVRVLGSKNSVARIRPCIVSRYAAGFAFILSARSKMLSISSTDKSVMSIK